MRAAGTSLLGPPRRRGIPLALRMLSRDWRSGELRVLSAALALAVAVVTGVGLFTDSVRLALEGEATGLLGADLVIASDHPVRPDILAAGPPSLRHAQAVQFPSMAIARDQSRLASITAVSAGYPLRGALRISQGRFGPYAEAKGIPAPGTAWLEGRLMDALDVDVGDTVQLGERTFRVAAVLVAEPVSDSAMLFALAPRLIINLDDLAATGLVQPASRVSYRELFAGDAAEITAFRKVITPKLRPGERLEGIEDAQPQVRSALDRARTFLNLAALVSVLLAGIAVAMSTRRFISRHLDGCAVMRCLGARQSTILRLFGSQLLWLGAIAALVGSLIGYVVQYGLERVFAGMLHLGLPSPSPRPLLAGGLTAVITLLGFAWPPLLRLKEVPTLRVLRRELAGAPTAGVVVYVAGAAAMFALIAWQSGDWRLAGYVAAGTAGSLLMLALSAGSVILLLRLLQPGLAAAWRFALSGLTRRSGAAALQIVAFGLGLTVLLLLAVVRTDLMGAWEKSLPPDAPNRFLINIQPAQLPELRLFFEQRSIQPPDFFPMVRGRLVAINGRPVSAEDYESERARALVRREFNLSWAQALQKDNRIVAGRWWGSSQHGEHVVSVEKELADTLGIRLGDRLTFSIAGSEIVVKVSSLREVQWDSFHVNFFVIAPPGVLDGYPASYICSLYLPRERSGLLNDLVRAFPNLTVIDVAAILTQVKTLIGRAALAVEYVFAFTLVAGILVMYAAVEATLDERVRETVLLRTLGAGHAQILRGLLLEFAGMGVLSGIVAASMAALLGHVVATRLLHLAYSPDWRLWLIGAVVGALGVGISGVLGTRFVLRYPPITVLRESG
jgi:putative ABC transport system permease protein